MMIDQNEGLLYSQIFTPKDAPEWAKDSETLWKRAAEIEDAQEQTLGV
jgi:hypothetical protein